MPRRISRPYRDPSGTRENLQLVEVDGVWHCLPPAPTVASIPVPGVRQITVGEAVAGRIRRTERYGSWIEISREVAHARSELLDWCRRYSNSELKSGGFRFHPSDWEAHSKELLSLPFVPEIDDPDEQIRALAGVERERREVEAELSALREARVELLKGASAVGHSRRSLADLLDVSFGRVQQLIHTP